MQLNGATYYVGSLANLTTRINSAVPGDIIILSNGVYTTSSAISVTRAGAQASMPGRDEVEAFLAGHT